jgi:hypothetical protein
MEQRQYFRVRMSETEVLISDRAGFCVGTLKDCSRFGLCITDLPRRIHPKNGYFQAVVTNKDLNFKLQVEEKWNTEDGFSNVVGAVIDNVPWEWTEMVMQNEPRNDESWHNEATLHV